MQNARDSFYVALRTRLIEVNPDRTVLLRGAVRPGILVEDAEAPFTQAPMDVFVLRWSNAGIDRTLSLPMSVEECEITYQTAGTQAFAGLDRGRSLSRMDSELLSIIEPLQTPKYDYSSNSPTEMSTNIFWGEPVFSPTVTQRERIGRSVRVRVYSYKEDGE